MIIKTFFISDNIKPRSIKILLFVVVLDFYLVINALMYNEDFISEIYHSNKNENFFYFLNNSFSRLFSVSIITGVIRFLIEFYFVDEKKLKKIFSLNKKKNNNIKYKIVNLMKVIDKKYKAFIILSYLITITSWYYLFCFNNVYPHTSMNWIKSSIFIIFICYLISFVYIFLESFLRKISFQLESDDIFKMSKLLSQ